MGEIVRTFLNNEAKMKRNIENNGKKKDAIDFREIVIRRSELLRASLSDNQNGRRFSPAYAQFVRTYKDNSLVSLKQISFDPISKNETWEIKDKELFTTLNVSREIGGLGIENIYINNVVYKYKGLVTTIGQNMYNNLGIRDAYNQMTRFLVLLTDYTKEIDIKKDKMEVKK